MKKLFIISIAVLFLSGAAYAVDYDYSGMINTRGSYISNSGSIAEEAYDYMYYDMEFDSTLKINPSDKSQIYLNWEIHDENWEATPSGSDSKTGDDQIAFKRAFGKYIFDNGMSTSFGLMTGGAFGTAFGDNADGRYRWRVDGKMALGMWGVILEKNGELGNGDGSYTANDDWDGEADDSDAYYAYLVTKAGDVTLQFLGGYIQTGDASGLLALQGGLEEEGADINTTLFVAAAMGSFGAIGFEAEFDYNTNSLEWDGADPDSYDKMGAYVNAWTDIDAFSIGGMAAYGSYDDDSGQGFGFGEDFGPGYWVMDWDGFGGGNAEYYASTLVAVYGSYAVSDALSFNAAIEYMMSNADDGIWEEATGTIFNLGGGYKLADNVKYSFGFATGQYDGDNFADAGGDYDPDPFTRAYHKIQISF
jgi:hypothetical protein